MTRMARLLETFCLLFSVIYLANAQNNSSTTEDSQSCVLIIDNSTTASRLRTAIFLADLEKAAFILSTSNETFSLAAGLMFTPEQECLLVRSQDRSRDPDIVAIKAIALSAELTGKTDKLSTVVVASFQLRCQCSLFTPSELDEMRSGFKAIFDDPAERRAILNFNGRVEEPNVPPSANPQQPASPVVQTRRLSPTSPASPSVIPTLQTNPQSSVNVVTDGVFEDDGDAVTDGILNDDDDDAVTDGIFDDGDEDAVTDGVFDDDEDVVGDGGFDDILEGTGRRLLIAERPRDSTPTMSTICAQCQPPGGCLPAFWCR